MVSDADKPVVHPERAQAEELFELAKGNLADADDVELGEPAELGSLAWAQVHLLKAIYHELRYGNDQAAARVEADAAALSDHTDAMDRMARDMRGLGDSLSRSRYRE
ncbi:hypothetical protein ACFFQW_30715 [Umezawaea endophytica]|uniref:Uncharacterized protein n=1 Tax=Umezawaea endophytica TaxID=1654476 RepID=A0A9X3AIR7_9PSEU|nr:hypothetical protein [Umezawaea endophytica]MCS7482911.1 hypothetical protein [Umezawaea endophytica]